MRSDDELWARLVAALDGRAVREERDGRLEITGPPCGRRVTLVMTRRDWSELVSIAYGTSTESLDDAIRYVQTLLYDQPDELDYLVYGDYELVPSATPVLPPDPDLLALDELSREHPDGIPGGRWVAHPPGASPRARGGGSPAG